MEKPEAAMWVWEAARWEEKQVPESEVREVGGGLGSGSGRAEVVEVAGGFAVAVKREAVDGLSGGKLGLGESGGGKARWNARRGRIRGWR